MQSYKILEMLNEGRIDELKDILRDEIYEDALKAKPGAKKRYSAMKKYFGYVSSSREMCQKPCVVNFEGKEYNSFCNAYSLALTTESCGELEMFSEPERYLNVEKLVKYEGAPKKLNLGDVIARAKSEGYKLKKSEVDGPHYGYLMHFDGAYYKIGLLEVTFNVINDGDEVTAYHKDGDGTASLVIQNDIGIGLILPVKCEPGFNDNGAMTIIEA